MKQKIIIGIAVLLLVFVLLLMVRDMFQKPNTVKINPYEFKLDSYKKIDSAQFCYEETQRLNIDIQHLNGLAIDFEDNLYLCGQQKVSIYNKNLEFEKNIIINAEVKNISVSENGEIFLGISDHIEIWNSDGKQLQSWKPYNSKSVITSIALGEKYVFVADAGNKIVLKYDFEGNFISEIGGKDTSIQRRGFIIPSPFFDILIGRDGEIWAVNSGMHTFEAYNNSGELISSWKRTSMQLDGFSGCCNPSHIAILSDGCFVTSEKGLVRIKIHHPSGDFKCVVAGPDDFDDSIKGIDLAVNSNDDIFLIVPKMNEVRIYKKKEIK